MKKSVLAFFIWVLAKTLFCQYSEMLRDLQSLRTSGAPAFHELGAFSVFCITL